MRCADASELMDKVMDGHAGSEWQAALLAHIADCAACHAEWLAMKRVDELLAAATPESPPVDFTSKVMARLPRRRPAQKPWAGVFALFAGTVVLSLVALLSVVRVSPSAESPALLGSGAMALLQLGGRLLVWVQAGWEIRQAVLSIVPAGLILLYALLALVALAMWLGVIAGVQGALRPAGK